MATCEVCGREDDEVFRVTTEDGAQHAFDSLECLVHRLAAQCANCGCRILGHGVRHDDTMYCCAHCAQHMGVIGLADRVSGGS